MGFLAQQLVLKLLNTPTFRYIRSLDVGNVSEPDYQAPVYFEEMQYHSIVVADMVPMTSTSRFRTPRFVVPQICCKRS